MGYTGATGRHLLWHTAPGVLGHFPRGSDLGRWVIVGIALLIVGLAWGPTAYANLRQRTASFPSTDLPPDTAATLPQDLFGSAALKSLQPDLDMMTITIRSTLPANLVDPLLNVTVPRDAAIFRPCDHNGIERVLGDVKPRDPYWLWTYDPPLLRANTETEFYFHIQRDRRRGAIPMKVEVIHIDLPGGSWTYELALLPNVESKDSVAADDRPVSARIDRGPVWHNFKHLAYIAEVHVLVKNQTDVDIEVDGYTWEFAYGGLAWNIDVSREVQRYELQRPQLRRHSIIEPGATESGWAVIATAYNAGNPELPRLSIRVVGHREPFEAQR